MIKKRSTWSATFVDQKIEKWTVLYRRIYFKNLRNEDNQVVKDSFHIDESDSLTITGGLSYGDQVIFDADEDLNNIEFHYPHGTKHGGQNE